MLRYKHIVMLPFKYPHLLLSFRGMHRDNFTLLLYGVYIYSFFVYVTPINIEYFESSPILNTVSANSQL